MYLVFLSNRFVDILQAFDLAWWPVSRDSVMYGVAVLMLINVLRDGKIEMTEALTLVLAYIFYILSKTTFIHLDLST